MNYFHIRYSETAFPSWFVHCEHCDWSAHVVASLVTDKMLEHITYHRLKSLYGDR